MQMNEHREERADKHKESILQLCSWSFVWRAVRHEVPGITHLAHISNFISDHKDLDFG